MAKWGCEPERPSYCPEVPSSCPQSHLAPGGFPSLLPPTGFPGPLPASPASHHPQEASRTVLLRTSLVLPAPAVAQATMLASEPWVWPGTGVGPRVGWGPPLHMLSRLSRQGRGRENRRLHAVAPALCVPSLGPARPTRAPHPAGACRALLRSRGWRQGLLVWDRAATCCPQPQPHNGALVSGRAAGSGQRFPAHPGLRTPLCGAVALAGRHGVGQPAQPALGNSDAGPEPQPHAICVPAPTGAEGPCPS